MPVFFVGNTWYFVVVLVVWTWLLCELWSGTTMRRAEARTVVRRMGMLGSEMTLVLLDGLRAASWAWGVRQLVDV